MLPRPVLRAVAALSLGAGALGFATGSRMTDLTETEAIAAYARIYAQDTGGAVTDCAAVPGTGAVWLVVHCGQGDRARAYAVGRDGGLLTPPPGPGA